MTIMGAVQGFQFDAEQVEKSFSTLQPVNDSVQAAESVTPGCWSRTTLTVSCRTFERGYSLELPLKSKRPNETPDAPPQNRQLHVMTTQVAAPMLQVLSVHEGDGVAEIQATAQGPNQCPPGSPNRVKLDGVGGGIKDVPFSQWTWKAPAVLDARLIEALEKDMIGLLHPFKAPGLPAQVWSLSVPGCTAVKLSASVAVFPDVRWRGRLTVAAYPSPTSSSGFETTVEGDLACHYNGREFRIASRDQARSLCKWFDCVEALAKTAVALLALKPGRKYEGIDNHRLAKRGELRIDPWPRLSLQIESSLFEQDGNGLLGHSLKTLVSGDPIMGVEGEASVLPAWLEDETRKHLLAPLLAALDVVRIEEVAQELGLWLVAEGRASLRAGVEAQRPLAATLALGRAAGRIAVSLEPRSVREYDGFVVQCGGADDITAAAELEIACEAPPDSPLPEPRDKKCRAGVSFAGCSVLAIEKWRPGCRFRRWQPAEDKPSGAVPLMPARSWPGGGEPGKLAEITWCD